MQKNASPIALPMFGISAVSEASIPHAPAGVAVTVAVFSQAIQSPVLELPITYDDEKMPMHFASPFPGRNNCKIILLADRALRPHS